MSGSLSGIVFYLCFWKFKKEVNTYFFHFFDFFESKNKWNPQKSEAEPPILIYVFKKISRLNYIFKKKCLTISSSLSGNFNDPKIIK